MRGIPLPFATGCCLVPDGAKACTGVHVMAPTRTKGATASARLAANPNVTSTSSVSTLRRRAVNGMEQGPLQLQEDGDGAVVGQGHLHVGAEDAGLHPGTLLPQR